MKYGTPAAFRQAVETRLLAHSKATGLSLDRLRKTVVFERFLARLLIAAPGRWLLKGGFALDLRFGTRARATRDIDLSRTGGADEATSDLIATQGVDCADHFVFAVERTDDLDEMLEGAAVRYRVTASLAGRRFEQVIVDVGFMDPPPAATDTLTTSDLLAFAGLEPVLLPVISLELQVAEKVHAYTGVYGAAGHPSTRVKDLVDLVVVSQNAALRAGELRDALRITFEGRGAQSLPGSLPRPPAEWRIPYRRLAMTVGVEAELSVGHALAGAFLDPVLGNAAMDAAMWEPSQRTWSTADP